MLIIANGAFKSGSTWQRDIIRQFFDFDEIPVEYQSNKAKTFVKTNKLEEFTTDDIINTRNFIIKSHLYHKRHIETLKNKRNVYVFIIERDIRDTIVSHYHHFKNQRASKVSFKIYYWLIGRFKAIQIIKYQNNWSIKSTNVFHSSYENLKLDFDAEIKKFAKFLNIELTSEKINEIKEKTNIKKIKENSNRKWFFRKGEVGDYKNYFNSSMQNDLLKLKKKINLFDNIIYFLLFEIRLLFNR